MKKIIMAGPLPPPINGQSVAFKTLIDGLQDKNYNVELVNITHKKKNGNSIFNRFLEYMGHLMKFYKLPINKGDLFYLTTAQSKAGFLRDFLFISLAKYRKMKIITHLHGGNFKEFYNNQSSFIKKMIKYGYSKVDLNIVLGNTLIEMFDFDSEIKNKTVAVSNGIDVLVKNNKKDFDTIHILYLSNLIESKGYIRTLETAKELSKEFPGKIKYHFAGSFLFNENEKEKFDSEREAKDYFYNFIKANHLEGVVNYYGVVDGEKKQELLELSNIFILPTRYSNEGQPISIIEAMAHGCVIISTNYRAIPDLVEGNSNGVLLDIEEIDSGSLEYNLKKVIEDKKNLKIMGNNSILRYKKEFTLNAHISKLLVEIQKIK